MKYNLAYSFDANSARVYLDNLIADQKQIELSVIREKRSRSQNNYLHVVITLWAIHTGYTLQEAKDYLKDTCEFMHYEKNGHMFRVETSKHDSKELTGFIEWIRNYSAKECGYYIPTPEEYYMDKCRFDNEIDRAKEFL
jgi:hypothetical protein